MLCNIFTGVRSGYFYQPNIVDFSESGLKKTFEEEKHKFVYVKSPPKHNAESMFYIYASGKKKHVADPGLNVEHRPQGLSQSKRASVSSLSRDTPSKSAPETNHTTNDSSRRRVSLSELMNDDDDVDVDLND